MFKNLDLIAFSALFKSSVRVALYSALGKNVPTWFSHVLGYSRALRALVHMALCLSAIVTCIPSTLYAPCGSFHLLHTLLYPQSLQLSLLLLV